MSLTGAAITEVTVESASKGLLAEWLGMWFDGAAHSVGGIAVIFPKVTIGFDQGPVSQPMDDGSTGGGATAKCEIRVVCHPRATRQDRVAETVSERTALVQDGVLFHFWVRSRVRADGGSAAMVNQVGELLVAILRNPDARIDLAGKGIAHMKPSKPEPMASDEWRLALVKCVGVLNYAIRGSI